MKKGGIRLRCVTKPAEQ